MNPERTVPPASLPLSLDEAKASLRVEHNDEDAYISTIIEAATQACEEFTGRSLITQTWVYRLDDWPTEHKAEPWWDGTREGALSEVLSPRRWLGLPRGPLQSVISITIYDEDDTATTWSSDQYYVAASQDRIYLRSGNAWPRVGRVAEGIEIEYKAGYGDDWNAVPIQLRQGLLQAIGHFYEHRETLNIGNIVNEIPMTAQDNWRPFRKMRLR